MSEFILISTTEFLHEVYSIWKYSLIILESAESKINLQAGSVSVKICPLLQPLIYTI